MRLARRAFLASLTASVVAPAVVRVARAAAPLLTLKLHHAFSAVSGAHEKFLAPWARKVEAQSGGRVRIDIFPSMQLGGAPAQLFDQARDGFADIVWTAPSDTPGRFGRIETFELPFLPSRRALVNSKALQDFAAANLRDEFGEIQPLCFSCRDHGVLHTSRPIGAVADVKGLRLHVPNRLAGEAVHALGAEGVIVPTPQLPMAVGGHAIDGCLVPWDAVPALRLQELLKQHTDFAESALCTSTFVLAMNKAAYARLPRDLQDVLEANSGQPAAALAGAMWDLEARAVADMVHERGDPVVVLPGDEVAHWRDATERVIALWRRQMRERKVDGGKLIASLHELIGKYASTPEPQEPQQAQPQQPAEQKIGTEPQRQVQSPPSQANAEITRPKAETPALAPPAPAPRASAPAPVVRRRVPKELDIPL